MARDGSRWRDAATVVAAAAALGVLAVPFNSLLVAAWDSHGVVYHAWYALAAATIGPDASVVFAAAVLGLLLVLFTLTEGKHVQGAILAVAAAAGLFVLPWRETVTLGPNAAWVAVGGVVGFTVGSVGGNVPTLHGEGRRAFPFAAKALYAVAFLASVVALFERYVPYRTPFVSEAAPLTREAVPATPVTAAVDIATVLAVLALLDVFLRYTDDRRVAVLANDVEQVGDVVAGLFDVAPGAAPRDENDGRVLAQMRRGRTANFSSAVEFEFAPEGFLSRWRVVRAEPIALHRGDPKRIRDRVEARQRLPSRVRRAVTRGATRIAPSPLVSLLTPSRRSHVERIDGADAVVLAVPLSDVVDESRVDDAEGSRLDYEDVRSHPPSYLDRYVETCREYLRDEATDVMLVATEGDVGRRAVAACERRGDASRIDPRRPRFANAVKFDLLGFSKDGPEARCDLFVVERSREGTDRGFDRLVARL